MKIRQCFVANSSSTSFYITNISKQPLRLVDFVRENMHLLDAFLKQYDWYQNDQRFSENNMIKDAESSYYDKTFEPGECKTLTFGDDQGPILGHVYDYILREGGTSKHWTWNFHEYRR